MLTLSNTFKSQGIRLPYEHQLQRSLMMLVKAGFTLRKTKNLEFMMFRAKPNKSILCYSTLNFASDRRCWVLRVSNRDSHMFDVKQLNIPFTYDR